MLVPPAATKTPFYKNQLLAAQWVQAAGALRGADELVLMGYSVPVTDLTVTSLIATQFKGDAIVPVNQDRGVIERANALGDRQHRPAVAEDFIDTGDRDPHFQGEIRAAALAATRGLDLKAIQEILGGVGGELGEYPAGGGRAGFAGGGAGRGQAARRADAAQRAYVRERLEAGAGSQSDRCHQLLAVINRQQSRPSRTPDLEWLLAAIDSHPA